MIPFLRGARAVKGIAKFSKRRSEGFVHFLGNVGQIEHRTRRLQVGLKGRIGTQLKRESFNGLHIRSL